MTKKILLGMALVASLVACTDDYKDWADPQVVAQPETVSFGDGSITTVGVIDFNQITDERVKVCTINPPSASDPAYTPSYSITIGDQVFDINADGTMLSSDLQDYVTNLYGKRPVERVVDATVSMWLGNGVTTVKTATSDVFHITVIPKAPHISQNYYLVGGPNDWKESAVNKMLKFNHSDLDVYEDPVFTVIMNVNPESDTWFAFGDDEACEAIANDDWSKLFGTKGESEDLSGSFDYRYNLGDDHSFHVAAGYKLIKVTLNMMDYTYKIEPLNIAEVFTYTFASTGGAMWFAFGDEDAIDAVGNGDWNQLFGTTGDSKDLSGSFDRRYNLGGEHSFCVDGSAAFYRFSVNMMTMTYEITPLNFEEFIYVPGNAQKYNTSAPGMPEWGWTPELAPALRSANFDGIYVGYAYMDGEFKFTKERNWNAEYNYDSFTTYGSMFTGQAGTGGNINCTEPGYYRLVADVANGSLNATKVTWGLVGPATPAGWDAGSYVVMDYNMADDCWEITTALNADEFKFTTNGSWDINLGGDAANLEENGPNLRVNEAGTYTIKLYPSRAQSDRMYATIVKQ